MILQSHFHFPKMMHPRHFVHCGPKECHLVFHLRIRQTALTGTSFQALDIHSTITDADDLFILPLGINI
jgi:hypothetical protein